MTTTLSTEELFERFPWGTDHTAALPSRLSPSRAKVFAQCPRKFAYTTVYRLSSPPTAATVKGTLAHAAFERIFDHPVGQRTVDAALPYVAAAWDDLTSGEDADVYRALAPEGSAEEAEILADAERFVRNWFSMEPANWLHPEAVELPDGTVVDGREIHLAAEVAGVTLHGYVDRFDRWVDDGVTRWSITDYKTGRPPHPRYADDFWFQLRVYALLAWKMWGIKVDVLRLVFVRDGSRDDIMRAGVDDAMLARTEAQVDGMWSAIQAAARKGVWPPKKSRLCDWCDFQAMCPAFAPDGADLPIIG